MGRQTLLDKCFDILPGTTTTIVGARSGLATAALALFLFLRAMELLDLKLEALWNWLSALKFIGSKRHRVPQSPKTRKLQDQRCSAQSYSVSPQERGLVRVPGRTLEPKSLNLFVACGVDRPIAASTGSE